MANRKHYRLIQWGKEIRSSDVILYEKFPKWIPIKEGVPKYEPNKEQLFIVSGIDEDFNKRYVYWAQAYAYGDTDDPERIFSVPGWSKMNVTHWMQLPKYPDE